MIEENHCHFVSSRGLLKSCDFHSLQPTSSAFDDTQHLIELVRNHKGFNGMSIYVCSNSLTYFVNSILPLIKHKFTLVSGDSDQCVPLETLSQIQTSKLLSSPFLIKWFSQNTRLNNIIQLPIGLDYHTIFQKPTHDWLINGETSSPIDQEAILQNIISSSKPFYNRKPLIYVNFSINSDRFGQRKKTLNIIPKDLLVINNNFIKRTETWKLMTEYTFILSPFGIGMDCHRTWEALCLGCIPIVCSPNFKQLFEDLPILNLDNWSDINQTLLTNTLIDFKTKHLNNKFNYDKLTLKYWINQIKKND